MKTVIIHGQSHKGSTYHVAHMLADKLNGETAEIFLPRDFGGFCTGCVSCFMDSENKCPHFNKLEPITKALDEADVIILASPVYVFHATGAMKAFLDHYGYRWMIHRPEGSMFRKQGVVISTAAGGGMKSTNKDMKDSLFFWGVAKRYSLGQAVIETKWERVSEQIKKRIDKRTDRLAKKIISRVGTVRPGLKTRFIFWVMRLLQKKINNPRDVQYWKEQGWLGKTRPWK